MPRAPKPLLVDSTPLLRDIALDDEDVIVTSIGDAKLIAIRHDGTQRRELVPESGPTCHVVTADRAGVYVATDTGVHQVDKAKPRLTKRIACDGVSSLALDANYIYAALRGAYAKKYADGGIVRVARGGGEPEWLVKGRGAYALHVDGDRIYFASDGQLWLRDGEVRALCRVTNPHAIVTIGDAVVFGEYDNNGSVGAYVEGSGVRTLAAHRYTADMIAIGDELFWGVASRKKSTPGIWRMRLGDPEPTPFAKFRAKAVRMAGNTQNLWWIDDYDGGLYTLPVISRDMPA